VDKEAKDRSADLRSDPQFKNAAHAARALGVTAKSLRVWEKLGLLTPGRTEAGWRRYGPADFARIHQVLALKSLGLSLAEIAELLSGRGADLDAVLELQIQALQRRRREAERSLEIIAAIRKRLKRGETLAVDDFANLIRGTTGAERLTAADVASIFQPYVERHFTSSEREAMRTRNQAEPARDASASDSWDAMFIEARTLMASGDPSTTEAADFARRWTLLAARFHLGDPVLAAKTKAVWEDALSTSGRSPPLPTTDEMLAFVEAAAKASGAMRPRTKTLRPR
jgi:DNA-binding transcriptional MerR regulator